MKKEILKKLENYSLVAVGVIAFAANADAQIVYTDIDPDFTGTSENWDGIDIDMDNDGQVDFVFYASYFSSTTSNTNTPHSYSSRYLKVNANANEVVNEKFGGHLFPDAISANGNINDNLSAFSADAAWQTGMNQTMAYTFDGFSGGDFRCETDKYVGVRFKIGTDWHYGWIRVTVDCDASEFIVKDYAYESTPNTPILAGEIDATASPATNILGEDIANNNNGSDLRVTFTKAVDETTLSEYRIMVVKASEADGFNLTAANGVSTENYTTYTPDGNDITLVLGETANDIGGDAIIEDVEYKIFVFSVADGSNAVASILSEASAGITLQTITSISDIENQISIYSAEGKIIIENNNITKNCRAEIIDLNGVIVNKIILTDNKTSIELNRTKIYIVRIFDGKNILTKKVYVK